MLFNTFEFAWFFVAVYLLYRFARRRVQNVILLAASYWFYGAWDPQFLLLIALSTLVDYLCGTWLERAEAPRRRKAIVALSIATNLGLLGIFKYFDFFAESLAALVSSWGYDPAPLRLSLVLPVGISFYTFQTMSYTLDVYRRQIPACHNLLDFAVFVAFFPQLVAGPIERASRLLGQIQRDRVISYDQVRKGSWLILYGLFKKAVVADNLAAIVAPVFAAPEQASGAAILIAVYAFAFQIYADFSGYSDIARGVAKLMGFELVVNFKMPYLATNPVEFWRRWHISLSSWLRDYLYIPLGGNRAGVLRTARNLTLTMLLGGLWHGAGFNFLAWGLFHGLLLALHRSWGGILGKVAPTQLWRSWGWHGLRLCAFFHLTCIGWLLFRVESLWHFPLMLGKVATDLLPGLAQTRYEAIWLCALVAPILALQVMKERAGDLYVVKRWPASARFAVYMFMVGAISVCGVTRRHEFIYFQF